MDVLWNEDRVVADWAGGQLGVTFVQPYTTMGVLKDGELVGAAIFGDHYPNGNLELTYVGRGTLTRTVQARILNYAFEYVNAARLTAKTARRNRLVCRLLPKAGFRYEGTQKRYFGPTKDDDAICFVMFNPEGGFAAGQLPTT